MTRRLGEAEIAQGVEQQAAEQKFDRQIVDALVVAAGIGLGGAGLPDIDDAIAHRERGRHEPVVRPRRSDIFADRIV